MLSKKKRKKGEPSSSDESDESEEAEEQVAAPSRRGGKRGRPAKDHTGRSNNKNSRTLYKVRWFLAWPFCCDLLVSCTGVANMVVLEERDQLLLFLVLICIVYNWV